jgi:hypothetical protein
MGCDNEMLSPDEFPQQAIILAGDLGTRFQGDRQAGNLTEYRRQRLTLEGRTGGRNRIDSRFTNGQGSMGMSR